MNKDASDGTSNWASKHLWSWILNQMDLVHTMRWTGLNLQVQSSDWLLNKATIRMPLMVLGFKAFMVMDLGHSLRWTGLTTAPEGD